jgi:hypothetical protein
MIGRDLKKEYIVNAGPMLTAMTECRLFDVQNQKFLRVWTISIAGPYQAQAATENGILYDIKVNPVFRYTGINDEKGEKIFEGDICERMCFDENCNASHKGFVSFENGEWTLVNPKIQEMAPMMYRMKGMALGVKKIGNMMINPEILFDDGTSPSCSKPSFMQPFPPGLGPSGATK